MGFTAIVAVILVAILVGAAVQYLMGGTVSYEWFVIAVAGAAGAFLASELLVTWSWFEGMKSWGPDTDGLLIVPAAIGGVILALVADFSVRIALPQPTPA